MDILNIILQQPKLTRLMHKGYPLPISEVEHSINFSINQGP